LASHLQMPLRKCMQEHTHREFKLWNTYLDDEWYRPSRSDYFLMRIAQRVQQVLMKEPNKAKLEHQEVFAKPEKQTADEEKEKVDRSKSIWGGIVGLVKRKKRGHN